MTRIAVWLALAFLPACPLAQAAEPPPPIAPSEAKASLNVRDFGAKGDGQTNDTAAIQKALDACTAAGGGIVTVPRGLYVIGSIVLGSNTTLQLEGRASLMGSANIDEYPLTRVRWEGEFTQGHRALISADKADKVAITGQGFIYGPPVSVSRLRNPRGPALIELAECTNVLLEGFSTQYQQLWSIHPMLCSNFTVRNLTIRSLSFNGDGIDVDSCRDVLIERCDIDTGDDAIALKSGRGMEAVRLERPTQNVVIKDCSLTSSIFAGLAIGTEMSGGVRDVRVENCTISGRENAIFLKSGEGRGGYMENITGENLVLQRSAHGINIELLNHGIKAKDPVTGDLEKWARLRNIRFNNIQARDVKILAAANQVPPQRPVEGFSLTNVTGTCGKAVSLTNILDAKLAAIRVTGYEGPLVTTNNVKGEGLDDAAAAMPATSSKSP